MRTAVRSKTLLACLVASLVTPMPASGQCPSDWLPGDGIPGVNGVVYDMTRWDPDGDGPESSLLIVGGEFSLAGETFANNVAAWDGTTWRDLGGGVDGWVGAVIAHNGHLYIGGRFH